MHQPYADGDPRAIYTHYADRIFDKRYHSPHPLRRYVHRAQYRSVLAQVPRGATVIDIGCGEGVLTCLLAARGHRVTGVDLSEPNIAAARALAARLGVAPRTTFLVADAQAVPLPSGSFEVAVSCHVLEHLPDFDQGLREVFRLTRSLAVIALPTLCNPCSLIQAGQGSFWEKSPRSALALLRGMWRAFTHLGSEGVDEGYGGRPELTHLWRYPWVVRLKLSHPDFQLRHTEASTICLPFFKSALPLIKFLDRGRAWPLLKYCGYGTTAVLQKVVRAADGLPAVLNPDVGRVEPAFRY